MVPKKGMLRLFSVKVGTVFEGSARFWGEVFWAICVPPRIAVSKNLFFKFLLIFIVFG